ncbi:DNA ligase D [Methyloferula stellata]|uniref:DNA ligase D n=1 Tax=Methyloferula stellata TaxID=876270 RepID=UPI00036A7889|nr:DNA ligase D [Methyloferula stellata]
MALETYRKKRNFEVTSEPRGHKARAAGHHYLIQKHAARRLHYDLRLEMDGVLKSWAVTRGPSLVPGEKRLAVHVEDHPLDYGSFEGTIPKGEYGGGTVLLWDKGSWTPIGDEHKAYQKGHLEFELHGEKLHGRWHLVRMHGKPGEKHENWLLIKGEDAEARTEKDPDILEEHPESVKTGRDLADISTEAPGWSSKTGKIAKPRARKPAQAKAAAAAPAKRTRKAAEPMEGARPAPLPEFVEPALATLVGKAPAGKRYVHEIKFDGYRLQVRIDKGKVKLLTRSGLDWTTRFGKKLLDAFKALPVSTALIDGELVVENDSGASSFSLLQADLADKKSDRFIFYAFDLLYLDGQDLRAAPLIARKEALQTIIASGSDPLRFSENFEAEGETILRHACRLSLEGLVSKLRDAPYHSGRSKDWLKSKCTARQEFVIGGYVVSTTSSKAIGSLVLGLFEDGKLRHVGRVGTGFSARVAADLFKKLAALKQDKSPFAGKLSADAVRGVQFVKPTLVAEIEFRAWTGDGNLRHASFRGLREDKPATEVVKEDAAQATPPPRRNSSVVLTHPDRLYWPEEGITKEGLANYYSEVWPRIAPFIAARPLSLLRCPDGVGKACFFQKHAWRGINKSIKLMQDPMDAKAEPFLVIDDLDGLIALVQAGVLEIHPWGAPLAALETPDTMIFDLDPAEGVSWEDIIAAAREIKDRLATVGLPSFVKTSGGKGLHVYVPLKPKAGWDEMKGFAKALAESMARDDPDKFISVATKAKRKGLIFVDYLRNGRGSTAVAPYSTRARPGAAVSMPLAWTELSETIGPAYFTIENAPVRLANLKSDPWGGFRAAEMPLPVAPKAKGKRAA